MLVLSGHRPRRPGDSIHRFRNIVVVFKRHSYLVKINNQKNKTENTLNSANEPFQREWVRSAALMDNHELWDICI
jgi:hypothetical protein